VKINSIKKMFGENHTKVTLSMLWLFATLNYIYADILTLMDASALENIISGSLGITPTYLFFGAILMEIPIAMIFLSLILERKYNRWANIIAGVIKTVAVAGSLMMGSIAMYYAFFVVIEVITTISIVVIAWKWKE
jgi:hypothetical protein